MEGETHVTGAFPQPKAALRWGAKGNAPFSPPPPVTEVESSLLALQGKWKGEFSLAWGFPQNRAASGWWTLHRAGGSSPRCRAPHSDCMGNLLPGCPAVLRSWGFPSAPCSRADQALASRNWVGGLCSPASPPPHSCPAQLTGQGRTQAGEALLAQMCDSPGLGPANNLTLCPSKYHYIQLLQSGHAFSREKGKNQEKERCCYL